MSDRLTRKEIKRNELVETLDRVTEFLRENARALSLAAVGLFALLIAIAVFISVRASRAEKVNSLLASAIEAANAPVGEDAAEVDDGLSFATEAERDARSAELFREVAAQGGKPGAVADVLLAESAASEGNLEDARNRWSAYLSKDRGSLLGATVELNLVALDRAEGRAEEALQRLEGWVDNTSSKLPQDVVLRELGVTFDSLGRTEEAQATYQRLVDEHPDSAFVNEARGKINT